MVCSLGKNTLIQKSSSRFGRLLSLPRLPLRSVFFPSAAGQEKQKAVCVSRCGVPPSPRGQKMTRLRILLCSIFLRTPTHHHNTCPRACTGIIHTQHIHSYSFFFFFPGTIHMLTCVPIFPEFPTGIRKLVNIEIMQPFVQMEDLIYKKLMLPLKTHYCCIFSF